MSKIVHRLPLNSRERTFSQHVSQWFCFANISTGNGEVQIASFTKPIQANMVGARNVPPIGASSFNDHAIASLVALQKKRIT